MLKFQTVAKKTAKNFRGLLFCRTLYTGNKVSQNIGTVYALTSTNINPFSNFFIIRIKRYFAITLSDPATP